MTGATRSQRVRNLARATCEAYLEIQQAEPLLSK